MKVVAVVPMKLNNRRLPQKNTKRFTNGNPLCYYILETLLQIKAIDEIYVYCSNEDIMQYIPGGVLFLKRPASLDTDTTKMNEILYLFSQEVPADVYVMTHTTAPFISSSSISKGLQAVLSGEYDSSFAAKKLQDFLWKDNQPFNYTLDSIPRTQDLDALYEETSGFYIYTKDIIQKHSRRIGDHPYIVEVGEIEGIDIDEAEDFEIADAVFNYRLNKGSIKKRIQVLDCTLRDGGYCNNWKFGFRNQQKIIHSLQDSEIDIIECGFISNKETFGEDISKFSSFDQIEKVMSGHKMQKMLVAMINYGEYDIAQIPSREDTVLDGLRVAFHKWQMEEALAFSEMLKAKGYKVFIQAMVSMKYSDAEFLELIHRVNDVNPYAFYIVDSFGMMKQKDLLHFFYLVEYNLKKDIVLGFHSHNNMQLAYANAVTLIGCQTNRQIVIDSSIFGMGRGAGNLNTELLVEYLNENCGGTYKLKPLLSLMDELLGHFYKENPWGYSLPNYLSAKYNTHPNYANYLDNKQKLTLDDMDNIFLMMENDKRVEYDPNYIEELYRRYMNNHNAVTDSKELKQSLQGQTVLLIAPGKSAEQEKQKIKSFIEDNHPITMAVNFQYPYVDTDYIFVCNLRRYRELDALCADKLIVTSNIGVENNGRVVRYEELLNEDEIVCDNAGMMAIQFLIQCECKKIIIAGIDGYSHDFKENYPDSVTSMISEDEYLDAMNKGMEKILRQFIKKSELIFLTTPKYIVI